MPQIQLLSEEAINQIAAGEVVENPASVVKELVENSLDAGSTEIHIDIAFGGLNLIRVSDNGSGMEKEDALLSIQRHATSKILQFNDLFRLSTMGFRGEALAAIAAVSKMTVMTATEVGTKLEIDAGEVKKVGPCARQRGTTVEVRDLFFNVPARKKFQKTPPALAAEVYRLVTTLALSRPDVSFSLCSSGKTVLETMAFGERAEQLIGSAFVKESITVSFEEGGLKLTGRLGLPSQARQNRMGQYLFINQRAVICAPINFAIREAFGNRLEDKAHPSYLLHLSLPPDLIDVNVHPQKREVRLRDEKAIRQVLQEAIRQSFEEPLRPIITFSPQEPISWQETPAFNFLAQEEPLTLFPVQEEIRVVGLYAHFLFIEEGEGLCAVDLCNARYRLIYNQLMDAKADSLEKQGLLLPFTVDCNPVEAAMILTHMEAIEALGFHMRSAGKQLFMIEAIPPFMREADVKAFILEAAGALQSFIGGSDIAVKRKEKLALLAARFAKNQKIFNVEEAVSIVRALKKTHSNRDCPQGTLTQVVISRDEIQRLFTH